LAIKPLFPFPKKFFSHKNGKFRFIAASFSWRHHINFAILFVIISGHWHKDGSRRHPAVSLVPAHSGTRLGIPFQYQNGSSIGIFVHSGAVLTGCRTVRNFEKFFKGSIILADSRKTQGKKYKQKRKNCYTW
jgi:hypothetical protein